MKQIYLPLTVLVLLIDITAQAKSYQAYGGDRQPAAEALLSLPPDIVVLRVNGTEFRKRGRLMGAAYNELRFLIGTHHLTLRYQDLWDHDQGDDYEKLKSARVEVTFHAESGCSYELVHPRPPSLAEAMIYQDAFDASHVSFRQTRGPLPPPAPPARELIPPGVPESDPAPASETELQTTVDVLKYWWEKASLAERQAFLRWTQSRSQP